MVVRGVTGTPGQMRRNDDIRISRQLTGVAQHEEQGQEGQQPPRSRHEAVAVNHGL